jgi:hypothetical protein
MAGDVEAAQPQLVDGGVLPSAQGGLQAVGLPDAGGHPVHEVGESLGHVRTPLPRRRDALGGGQRHLGQVHALDVGVGVLDGGLPGVEELGVGGHGGAGGGGRGDGVR